MREILFKAKRIDNGEWVEGFLFFYLTGWCIGDINTPLYPNDYSELIGKNKSWFEIDTETLCQYTGLTDKNGVKIWENDVIRYKDDIINKEKIDLIEYNETHASFVRLHKSQMGLQYLYINEAIAGKCEVIGNIFDNPELLEEANE